MNKKENKLTSLLNRFFGDKKKRHISTLVVILPFLIIIGICGVKLLSDAKELLALANEQTSASNDKYKINDGTNAESYVLRDNATAIQKEYFAQLKQLYEKPSETQTKEDIAAAVVKCFVADFYTMSNKQGQYDVGGMYYVYTPQRYEIYIQARDQFYKYINNYINQYGQQALLEVASVEAVATHTDNSFKVLETNAETGEEEWVEYNTFNVVANWTYVEKEGGFDISHYNKKMNFIVIDYCGRYEITYAGNEVYGNE